MIASFQAWLHILGFPEVQVYASILLVFEFQDFALLDPNWLTAVSFGLLNIGQKEFVSIKICLRDILATQRVKVHIEADQMNSDTLFSRFSVSFKIQMFIASMVFDPTKIKTHTVVCVLVNICLVEHVESRVGRGKHGDRISTSSTEVIRSFFQRDRLTVTRGN